MMIKYGDLSAAEARITELEQEVVRLRTLVDKCQTHPTHEARIAELETKVATHIRRWAALREWIDRTVINITGRARWRMQAETVLAEMDRLEREG